MKFHIVGIDKCGTVSLMKDLQKKGHEVIRNESMYWDGGPEKHLKLYPDYQVIFIVRDPIERIWSQYWYKRYHQEGDRQQIKVDLREAFKQHPELIDHTNYRKYLDVWRKTKPFVFQLETLQKFVLGFPKENVSPDKRRYTPEELTLILNKLAENGI